MLLSRYGKFASREMEKIDWLKLNQSKKILQLLQRSDQFINGVDRMNTNSSQIVVKS